MNSSNSSNHSNQPWMIPIDHAPETFNYMVSRPPGSVLPLPPQQQHQHPHQQQPQHQQQPIPLQHSASHPPNQQEQSISPPAQAHEYESSKNSKGGSRAVIPSKRAAQNRAAQKAFRQRREQYIKDLEIKVKEMEGWQEEMEKLRKENGELRQRVVTLEHHVVVLSGGDASKLAELERSNHNDTHTTTLSTPPIAESDAMTRTRSERSMSLPTAPASEGEVMTRRESASPSHFTSSSTTAKRPHQDSRLRHEQKTAEPADNDTLQSSNVPNETGSITRIPLPLRAPKLGPESSPYHLNDRNPALIVNDTTTASLQLDDASKRRKLDDSVMGQAPISNVGTNFANNAAAVNAIMHNNTDNPLLISAQQQQREEAQLQYPLTGFWGKDGSNSETMVPPPGAGDFDLDFDFDPFFEDDFGPTITSSNDFLPSANSGQVLDDLFAMLQTRQRPQIPMVPSEENSDLNNNNNNSADNFNECLG
ncbi:hypothetical protein BD408DRAFT_482519 [Parasitella parasitica]|nr:hypothetical protein BD408DRAFT_482519 [Parasitella parasitica]